MAKSSNFPLSIGGKFFNPLVEVESGGKVVNLATAKGLIEGMTVDTALLQLGYVGQAIADGPDSWDDVTKHNAADLVEAFVATLPAKTVIRFYMPKSPATRHSYDDMKAWEFCHETTKESALIVCNELQKAESLYKQMKAGIAESESLVHGKYSIKHIAPTPSHEGMEAGKAAKRAGGEKVIKNPFA